MEAQPQNVPYTTSFSSHLHAPGRRKRVIFVNRSPVRYSYSAHGCVYNTDHTTYFVHIGTHSDVTDSHTKN